MDFRHIDMVIRTTAHNVPLCVKFSSNYEKSKKNNNNKIVRN